MSEEKTLTYREKALAEGRNYTVTDVPPIGTSIVLGIQHYLTMLGATVSRVESSRVVCLFAPNVC